MSQCGLDQRKVERSVFVNTVTNVLVANLLANWETKNVVKEVSQLITCLLILYGAYIRPLSVSHEADHRQHDHQVANRQRHETQRQERRDGEGGRRRVPHRVTVP